SHGTGAVNAGRTTWLRWTPPLSSLRSPMIPDILHIGPVPIHLFGIFLALAFLAAGWAAGREFERRGYDPALASSAGVWAAVGGWAKPPGVRVHPPPLYEAAAYVAIFALLWRLRRESVPAGALLALYLVLSGVARFLVEFVRVNPRLLFGLTEAQLVSLALVA